jgi:NAD(P)-dependent dehydrogenase (short-subunit alcohol dehydrogenase family)
VAGVWITGSAAGLGQMAARLLVAQGHEVMLHARSAPQAGEALVAVPGAAGALAADLSSIAATRALAAEVNALGRFDALLHKRAAAIASPARRDSADGLPQLSARSCTAAAIPSCGT